MSGYYCPYGQIEPILCPIGNYCPIGSTTPKNCSATRYNPSTGGTDITACQACKGGYNCYEDAISDLITTGDKYKCPNGNFCPIATWRPFPCKAGTYSDYHVTRFPATYLSDCLSCPEHFYCPLGTSDRYAYPCPSGTYCPIGSAYPKLCPPGKYCESTTNKTTSLPQIVITTCP